MSPLFGNRPLLVPHEGDVQLLTDLLGGGTLENWQLGRFKANLTPAETDTASTYTAHETAFSGYTRKTLTRVSERQYVEYSGQSERDPDRLRGHRAHRSGTASTGSAAT